MHVIIMGWVAYNGNFVPLQSFIQPCTFLSKLVMLSRARPSVCCTSFASRPETVLLACISYRSGVTTRIRYGITRCNGPRIYLAEVVHTKKSRSLARLADSLLCSVMSQSSYRTYCQTYPLVFLRRSRCCLFCSLRVRQEAKKAEVVNKCHQTF